MPKNVSEKPTGLNTVQYDKNVINNNDRVKVSTNDGSGVNIRSGPGKSYAKIRSVLSFHFFTVIIYLLSFVFRFQEVGRFHIRRREREGEREAGQGVADLARVLSV